MYIHINKQIVYKININKLAILINDKYHINTPDLAFIYLYKLFTSLLIHSFMSINQLLIFNFNLIFYCFIITFMYDYFNRSIIMS
jgi:hypothetical protein